MAHRVQSREWTSTVRGGLVSLKVLVAVLAIACCASGGGAADARARGVNAAGADDVIDPGVLRKVRAACVLQLIRFSGWPEGRFESDKAPVVVGVPRGLDVTPYLVGTFRDHTAGARPIVLREIDLAPVEPGGVAVPEAAAAAVDAAIESCHVVYVPGDRAAMVSRVWPVARRANVLVLVDQEDLLTRGGVVAMPVKGRRVKLVVNRSTLEASGVTVSSRVMKLATVVEKEVRP